MWPEIQRHPGRDRCLQGPGLAADGPAGGPAPGDQLGAGVVAGEADRGQVQVQPGGVGDAELADGPEHQLAADILGHARQGLQRPAEPVVVQQHCRGPEQLGHRGRRGPPGNVIQRRRGGQPAGRQHARDLAVAGQGPAAARDGGVHDLGHPEPPQVVRGDQQRADVPAGAGRGLVEPGQPGDELLQLATGLQLVEAAEVCHNVLAQAGALAAALDQLQVLVAAAAAADRLHLRIHVATTLGASSPSFQATRHRKALFRARLFVTTPGSRPKSPGGRDRRSGPPSMANDQGMHGDHAENAVLGSEF